MTLIALTLLFIVIASFANAALNSTAPEPTTPSTPCSSAYNEEDWRTAVHEAGHVVAAWFCTATSHIVRVTLDPGPEHPDSTGLTTTRQWCGAVDHAWCCAVRDLAGITAELVVFGNAQASESSSDLMLVRDALFHLVDTMPPWRDAKPSASDYILVRAYRDPLPQGQSTAFATAYRQTRALVRAHRERLLRVAAHLVVRRTLTEADLEHVLGPRLAMKFLHAFGSFFVQP